MKKNLIVIWSLALAMILIIKIADSLSKRDSFELHNRLRDQYEEAVEAPETEAEEYKGNDMVILPKYSSLLEVSSDAVGWIKIPGTNIDYPVVKGLDNDFYLKSNIKGEPDKAGSIFMDYRNDGMAEERHTIIYGHHMKDGTMFMALMSFKEPEFLLENRIIEFNTLYQDIQWEIFSAYVTDTDFDYLVTSFTTLQAYDSFLNSIKSKSYYPMNSDITSADTILTLSTCTYEFKDARFVIHARRLYK